MFKWYGLLGILMIIFGEINFIFRFTAFSFPIIWFGFIFLVDAIVYKLRGDSLLSRHKKQFLLILVFSAVFWWVFEIFNVFVDNWQYVSSGEPFNLFTPRWIIAASLAFTTVLPAFFETSDLFKSLNVFSRAHLKRRFGVSKNLLFALIGLGVFCTFASIILPTIFFPLIWFAPLLILDPINYLHGVPSIIGHLKKRELQVPLVMMLSGITLGFFWEFWNYWATTKWIYTIPHIGFLKIFEMPVLGYFGYLPFGLSIYAMYYFAFSLFKNKKQLLKHKLLD
jgi:hypothetical protein